MILEKIGYGLGMAKNYRVGSGIGYPSGTADQLPTFINSYPLIARPAQYTICWSYIPFRLMLLNHLLSSKISEMYENGGCDIETTNEVVFVCKAVLSKTYCPAGKEIDFSVNHSEQCQFKELNALHTRALRYHSQKHTMWREGGGSCISCITPPATHI